MSKYDRSRMHQSATLLSLGYNHGTRHHKTRLSSRSNLAHPSSELGDVTAIKNSTGIIVRLSIFFLIADCLISLQPKHSFEFGFLVTSAMTVIAFAQFYSTEEHICSDKVWSIDHPYTDRGGSLMSTNFSKLIKVSRSILEIQESRRVQVFRFLNLTPEWGTHTHASQVTHQYILYQSLC